jgi:hypothetical protein
VIRPGPNTIPKTTHITASKPRTALIPSSASIAGAPKEVGDQRYHPDDARHSDDDKRAVMIRSEHEQENQSDDDDREPYERRLEAFRKRAAPQ